MADSKIGWRITFIGILIAAFVTLLVSYNDYFIPFIIYFSLKLIILINGLRPRLNYQKVKKDKTDQIDIYSFIDISKIKLETFVNTSKKEIQRKFTWWKNDFKTNTY